ncbi:ral GTPase-activating protein subunit beta isoform X1 [Hydra vulgaris]|uniref:ral GTPase-activating protein subunit beta isoform X1 n=1 Tax=Hydra vulgaris TaxID=6087 RepID=UPI001F5E89C3|nr:ral GTPase-activating protein subunit beta-like [Hydra vulgaris]
MYSGWISERRSVEDECGCSSVLNSYPQNVGRDVTSSIIRSLVLLPNDKKGFFKTTKDLEWTMDVICYGLTMSLAEAEMIKNCVFLYLEWITVMLLKPKPGIPVQIIENKEHYFSVMLKHMANLFIPRESSATFVQASFCVKVLQNVREIVEEGHLKKASLENVLRFYLGVSGHLLSVPPVQGGLAEQLCGKLINCLLNVWLHACCNNFPSPPLWCTLAEMVLTWRHHHMLILQWNKLMFSLTCKVLMILYGPDYPLPSSYNDEDPKSEPVNLPSNMSNEVVVQCWHRFMHIIGNPVDLCKYEEISNTEQFRLYNSQFDRLPELHPSLKSLPDSFYNIMNGISVMVSMFLGASKCNDQIKSPQTFYRGERKLTSISVSEKQVGLKDTKKSSSLPRYFEKSNLAKLVRDDINIQSKQSKRNVECVVDTNSVLHIFSAWLFETCLTGIDLEKVLHTVGKISLGLPLSCLEMSKDDKEQHRNFLPVKKNDFEPGRAQTFCTLCHIFCRQKAVGQAILPVYLSRFYLCLAVGLCYGETRAGMVLGSILLSAKDLFKLDLQGVQVLVPHVLQALEIVLPVPDSELALGYDFSIVELRQSCIQILLSMICLPLHFMSLPIQALCQEKVNSSDTANSHFPQIAFISLHPRVTRLLVKAIEVETNPMNTQMLLGGAKLLMEDAMQVELHNHELYSSKAKTIPSIILDEPETSGTSKLIDLAESTNNDATTTEDNIGLLGDSSDIMTTKGLFCSMSDLLCQKLMFAGKWRGDLAVTLAALEFLSGMAQLNIKFVDKKVARKTLKWLCDYIEFQAKQPPPSHSKDLHSVIVATFSCISVWVVSHSWLLDDNQCLTSVMEVIELGISGNKSKGRFAEVTNVLKGDKELKPVSFRVRESAEALLALIMEHAGFFPTPCGPESMFTLMDEKDFCTENDRKFNYYALDGSLIIGLLEDGLHSLPESLPSVMSIIRGPTGKRVCLLQLRHFSRVKQYIAEMYTTEPSTPYGLHKIPEAPPVSQRCYPPGMDSAETTKSNFSIPEIKDLLKNEKQMAENEHLRSILSLQIDQENKAKSKLLDDINGSIPQKQPDSVKDINIGRLILSHLGFLNLENLQISTTRQVYGLQKLVNTEEKCLLNKLEKLDAYPCRTFDTMFVFYVKKGQNDPISILSNKITSIDSHFFMEFLQSLGWPVSMSTHTGWNGGFAPNLSADKKLYYYADPLTELAIHVPAVNIDVGESFTFDVVENSMVSQLLPSVELNSEEHSVIEGKSSKKQSVFESTGGFDIKHRSHHCHSETKVVVAWLQEFADEALFPALDLIELSDPHENSYSTANINYSRVPEKEVVIIFVHPLKTGLYRIKINALFGSSVGGPLISGMVVSRRVLGSMVRNTAINICRRRRLELDSCSPPHVCRKIKIQEIIREHAKEMNIPDFYTGLLKA